MTSRAVAASSDAPGVQSGEGGSQPTLLLHLLDGPDFTGTRYDVRQVNRFTAERWFGTHHYTGTAGAPNSDFYGYFLGDMASLVGIGYPANEHGLAAKFGLADLTGNREVTRVACHPDAPKNTASRSVMAVLRRVGLSWAFSYADTGQGHHGGIYQALGAVYVGLSPSRGGYVLDGVPTHPRAIVHRFGTQAHSVVFDVASRMGMSLTYDPDSLTPKHTYIIPVGPRASEVRERLAPIALPYPKRKVA